MLTYERAKREWSRLNAPLIAFAVVNGHFEAVDVVGANANQIGAIRVVVHHRVLVVVTRARCGGRRHRCVLEHAIGAAEYSRRFDHELAIAIEQTFIEAIELTRAVHLAIGKLDDVILDSSDLCGPFDLIGPIVSGDKHFVAR